MNEENFLSFNDLVSHIKGEKYNWSMLYIEAKGNLGDQSMIEFEKKIYNSEKGVAMNWKEVIDISSKIEDTVDLLLIGCKDVRTINKFENDKDMYQKCDVVIEMIDSSYWLIHSNNEDIINNIFIQKNNYRTTINDDSTTSIRGIAEPINFKED